MIQRHSNHSDKEEKLKAPSHRTFTVQTRLRTGSKEPTLLFEEDEEEADVDPVVWSTFDRFSWKLDS